MERCMFPWTSTGVLQGLAAPSCGSAVPELGSAIPPYKGALQPVTHNKPRYALAAAGVCASALIGGHSRRSSRRHQGRQRRCSSIAVSAVEIDKSETLPFVRLTSKEGGEAIVHLYGACVTSYKAGGKEWIAVRKDALMDGSKPISGGLPHCFPQFGPGEIQQHGFARNLAWEVVQDESSANKCVLELKESEATLDMWPHQFRCLYSVELLPDRLDTSLIVKNTSDKDWSFTTALHSYYDVSKIDDCKIIGSFKGKEKLDKTEDPPTSTTAENDTVSIEKFTEEIYSDALPGKVMIKDPSKGELTIESSGGWRDVVIWSPYGDEKMGADKFVCVESAQLAGVQLSSQEEWEGKMSLVPTL